MVEFDMRTIPSALRIGDFQPEIAGMNRIGYRYCYRIPFLEFSACISKKNSYWNDSEPPSR